jgi:hypothetical protein
MKGQEGRRRKKVEKTSEDRSIGCSGRYNGLPVVVVVAVVMAVPMVAVVAVAVVGRGIDRKDKKKVGR